MWYWEVPLAIQLHPQKTPTNILCLPDSPIPFPLPTLQNPRSQMFFPHKFQLWHVWIVYSLLPQKLRYSSEKMLVQKTMFSFEKRIPFQVKNLQFSRVGGSTATVSSRVFLRHPNPCRATTTSHFFQFLWPQIQLPYRCKLWRDPTIFVEMFWGHMFSYPPFPAQIELENMQQKLDGDDDGEGGQPKWYHLIHWHFVWISTGAWCFSRTVYIIWITTFVEIIL